jgi:hypothetical protein
VVTFGLPALPTAETRTVCMGWSSLYAEVKLMVVLEDILSPVVELRRWGPLFAFVFGRSKS